MKRKATSVSTWVFCGIACVVLCGCVCGCERSATISPPEEAESNPAFQLGSSKETKTDVSTLITKVRFTDVHLELGVDFSFETGAEGDLLAVETLGGGCGWIDYDNDGLWEFVCNQGSRPGTKQRSGAESDALFRNVGGRFIRVDREANFRELNYSHATAVGDFDDDGFSDIYISNVFENTLWRNCGDGTFIEVASESGVADSRWSSTAAWADLNQDGLLDLYVCNYLVYDPTNSPPCFDPAGRKMLCNPASLDAWTNACFISQGDGTFIDEAGRRGLGGLAGRSLSVAILDFNGDFLTDIYVANDTDDNCLYLNQGGGFFLDQAALQGCATNHLGIREAGMGIAVNDVDGNGFQDLYLTHYTKESNTLYMNLGDRGFHDVTNLVGLHEPTLRYLGFGVSMQDFDYQGAMKVFVANGHVATADHEPDPKMPAQLFAYDGHKRWQNVSQQAGDFFAEPQWGRGVATADFDDDGDLDILMLNLDQATALLRNDSKKGSWLTMSFRGRQSNRCGIGAVVEVKSGPTTRFQQLAGGTSFASTHQPLLTFGFGQERGPVDVRVRWPSGIEQRLESVVLNQKLVVVEP